MTLRHIYLTEWQTLKPVKRSPSRRVRLKDYPDAQRLAEELTNSRKVEIFELAQGLELRTKSHVGRFALGNLLVTIKPKIHGAPLMALLRYAYRLRNLGMFDAVSYDAFYASFEDLLINQLAFESIELLSRGLHRDYLRTDSLLASPHGRIDFGCYLQVAANAGVAMPCTHYPRSEDTGLNQVLQGGLALAARITLDRELGSRVRRIGKSFAGRLTPSHLNTASFNEAWHSLDRRTAAYRPALTLIEMLMNTQGAALTDPHLPTTAAGFLFDMNRFFQALLSRFLNENLPSEYECRDEQALHGMFCYDSANNPQNRRSPLFRPDFLVLHKRQVVAVLDAKYRDLWDTHLPREMLYQLSLYALGQGKDHRQAIILYPTLKATTREQVICINDPISEALKAKVVLRPVNLLKLVELLNESSSERIEYAMHLVFGKKTALPYET